MSIRRTVRELIRHSITKVGLTRLELHLRERCGQQVEHLRCGPLSDRFSTIYRNGAWLNGRPSGSLSGFGSELDNTKMIRPRLPEVLKSIGTETLLDLGCGDFNWMKEVELPSIGYIGADIVRSVIEANRTAYAAPRRSFLVLDATSDTLPRADTVLCREVLFHLSFDDIWRVIRNIRNCGASFLIATNDNGLSLNADIISGDFRMLNLNKSPFHFPAPQLSFPDSSVVDKRIMAVWEVSSLPKGRSE